MASYIHLRDFFLTGRFGPIQLGATKTAIEALLGPPDNWGGSLPWRPHPDHAFAAHQGTSYRSYPIWLYDAIELHFGTQDELFLIHCDHFEKLSLAGYHFQIDRWLCVDPPLHTTQVHTSLDQQQIPYHYHPTVYGGVFRSPMNVELGYDSETDQLVAISLYDDRYVRPSQST